jgi:lipopolysaccharide heptosyltransferase II
LKILIRATNWVGDAVMCIPALAAVRRRWPQAEISILARPWVASLYNGQGLADRILLLKNPRSVASALRREGFDCALLLQNAFHAAWIAWRAGIRERIGYALDGRGWLLTRAVPIPRHGEIPAHEAYYYLELLRRAGWIEALPLLEPIRLQIAPEARELAEQKLLAAGVSDRAPRIAVAPGATFGSAKCWAPERFAALADRLIADFGASVILFGTASERDITEQIAARMSHNPVNLAGQTSIGELPALFSACRLFVGNDSGAMHVAAAAGLPVVAVFGPTDPEGTSPVTSQLSLVREPVSCSPCFLRHCPVDRRCMTRVTGDAVYAAARTWLERPAGD